MKALAPLSCLALRVLCLGALLAVTARAELLRNGDMSAGETQPTHWTQRWIGHGRIVAMRDQAVFRSAPASLRLSAQDGAAKGQIYQSIPVTPGDQLTATAWVRCEGADTTAQVALQFFKAGGTPIAFKQVRYVAGNTDWVKGSINVAVPAEAATVGFLLLIDGDGQAWLDDAALVLGESDGAPVAAPAQTPAAPKAASPVAGPRPNNEPLPGEGTLISLIADFRVQGFTYGYESWKSLPEITRSGPDGLALTGASDGGAGIVYATPAPIEGATHLRLRYILNSGHNVDSLHVKLFGNPQASFDVSIPAAVSGTVQTRLVALPQKRPARVEQVQMQGTFTPGQRFNLTLVDAAFVRLP